MPYGFAIEFQVEDAVLKGNWKYAFEILGKDDKKVSYPIARLIMAHACLATNHNNASLLLFLSIKEEDGLKLWSEWTESLLHRHPQNPVALYLSADAMARDRNIKAAIGELTQLINRHSQVALAYNARGVLEILDNQWNEALLDFHRATQLDPDLSDAYANLGTYWVLMETPESALEAFNGALRLNPEFALAYNGRGCAYFGMGKFHEATNDFEKASQLIPFSVIAAINKKLVFSYVAKPVIGDFVS